MAVGISILSIVILAAVLHLILYYGFKIDARQLLIAATIASLVIVFVMMQLYRLYSLAPLAIIGLLFLLAVSSALIITFGEQYFSLFPKKREAQEPSAAAAAPYLAPVPPAGEAPPPGSDMPVATPAVEAPLEEVAPEGLGLEGPVGVLPAEGITAEVAPEEPAAVVFPEAPVVEAGAPVAPAAAEPEQPSVEAVEQKGEEEVVRLIAEAYDKLEQGGLESALESFQLAIIFVDDPGILTQLRVELARIWFMLGNPDMADIELREALRLAEREENREKEQEIRDLIANLPVG